MEEKINQTELKASVETEKLNIVETAFADVFGYKGDDKKAFVEAKIDEYIKRIVRVWKIKQIPNEI
jgi:hypothetical protein